MRNLNRVTLLGNLTDAPKAKTLATGSSMATFTVATNSIWQSAKTKEKKSAVEFHPVVVWGKLADITKEYLKKGDRVYVEGRLQTRSWLDKEKQKHYRTEVVGENMILLGGSRAAAQKEAEVAVVA